MKYLILLLLVIGSRNTMLDNVDRSVSTGTQDSIYTFLQKMPQFPGGELALSKYIRKHALPQQEDVWQGAFQLSFIVGKDGKLTAVGIINKTPETWTAAEAAMVKIIKDMPDWIPGEIKGKKVACRFYIPLHICPQE